MMDISCIGLILLSALLWGSTDALIKLFSPPQLKQKREDGFWAKHLIQDFIFLLGSPGSIFFHFSLKICKLVVKKDTGLPKTNETAKTTRNSCNMTTPRLN